MTGRTMGVKSCLVYVLLDHGEQNAQKVSEDIYLLRYQRLFPKNAFRLAWDDHPTFLVQPVRTAEDGLEVPTTRQSLLPQ